MNPAMWTTVVMCVLFVGITSGYNVLVMLPLSSKSHIFAFQPIAEELARRGHQVTIASSLPQPADQSGPGLKHVYLQLTHNAFQKHKFSFFDGDLWNATIRQKFLHLIQEQSVQAYKEPFIQDLVRSPRDTKTGQPKYDVVVVDAVFNEYMLPLAYHMGVPSIYFSPSFLVPPIVYAMDIPLPLSYIPVTSTYTASPFMDFFERARNLFQSTMFLFFFSQWIHPYFDSVIAKHLPDSPPIAVLQKNVSFVLQNMKIPLIRSAPSMPYYVEVGAVHCKPAQKLPPDLEDFMQSSGDAGVIYFSLGSYTKGESMPKTMRDKVVEAFAQLPQKVLWKYEKDIENLPKNIKLVKWAPQQDILGHPKIRVFITHGGSLSTQEGAYHGCPLLTLPLIVDQMDNAANAVIAGMAEYLDWKTFTAKDLLDTITRLTKDERYKENALKVSLILRDTIVEPKVTAAFWIEYVIRHRGAHHLKSGAGNLNFFQYFMLDVIGSVVLCLVLFLVFVIYSIKWLFAFFRTSPVSAKKTQ